MYLYENNFNKIFKIKIKSVLNKIRFSLGAIKKDELLVCTYKNNGVKHILLIQTNNAIAERISKEKIIFGVIIDNSNVDYSKPRKKIDDKQQSKQQS